MKTSIRFRHNDEEVGTFADSGANLSTCCAKGSAISWSRGLLARHPRQDGAATGAEMSC